MKSGRKKVSDSETVLCKEESPLKHRAKRHKDNGRERSRQQSKNTDRAEYTKFMCLVSKTTQGSGDERILC